MHTTQHQSNSPAAIPTTEKFAIIGAGPVGISAARALKIKGIAYDQFESTDAIGGNWRHGVYSSAHIISSRKTTEFPDYPMPESYPDFPSAAQMLEYLESYARHYHLFDGITFNTTVEKVFKTEDNFFTVQLSCGESRVYAGIIVCNGHHWDRRWPKYDGEFSGQLIHSKDYKTPDQLKGKRVLVIGGGNSACDIVCEAARVASSAHLSLRRGYWFLPKTIYGQPTAEILKTWMPVWMQRIYIQGLLKIVIGDYKDYGLQKPDHKLFEHHPTINTELLHYLKHGKIKPHRDIRSWNGNTVEFEDGSQEEFDLIVCGTGYHVSLPFMPAELVAIDGSVVKTQWGMVSPAHRNLFVYGWTQARYGFGPLLTPASELLADLILLQRQLTHPLGKVLQAMAQPVPTSHLLDPMAALRQIKLARLIVPFIPFADKYLVR